MAKFTMPAASILEYAGEMAPLGWLLCNGKAVSRSKYKDLFSVLGTRFGKGNGRTTFNVPDKRWFFTRGFGGLVGGSFGTAGVSTANNNISLVDHNFNRSGIPVRFTTTTTLPTGLSLSTTYWTIYQDEVTLQFATTEANALAGTALTISSTGTGTHTVTQYADPDFASRTAMVTGGAVSDRIGSVQRSAFASHTHTVTDPTHVHSVQGYAASGAATGLVYDPVAELVATAVQNTAAASTGVTNQNTGGNETRPDNIYMNYIIKY